VVYKKYIPLDDKKKIDYKIFKNCTKCNKRSHVFVHYVPHRLSFDLTFFFKQKPSANNKG